MTRSFVLLALSWALPLCATAATHNVLILHHSFEPESVYVQPGDTVRWTHQDAAAHTVTGNGTELWDSEYMSWGDVYLRVFVNPGSHDYVCLYHPMFGKVVVGGSTKIRNGSAYDHPEGKETSQRLQRDVLGRKVRPLPTPFEALIRAGALSNVKPVAAASKKARDARGRTVETAKGHPPAAPTIQKMK